MGQLAEVGATTESLGLQDSTSLVGAVALLEWFSSCLEIHPDDAENVHVRLDLLLICEVMGLQKTSVAVGTTCQDLAMLFQRLREYLSAVKPRTFSSYGTSTLTERCMLKRKRSNIPNPSERRRRPGAIEYAFRDNYPDASEVLTSIPPTLCKHCFMKWRES